ncbi:MAG TPA: PPC domain-containing protein [Humisphaera sp.]|jgi:hypothetical protein|nr:PPC domain-containing protein [Humisphaera sp.]
MRTLRRKPSEKSRPRKPIESLESRLLLSADPGNDPTTALAVGTLTPVPFVMSNSVSSADSDDYFQFNLASTSKVSVLLNGMSDDADVSLLDSQGNQLYFSNNVGTTAESFTKFLDAGTYYVDVQALKTDNSTYTLALSANAPLVSEAGHTTNTATNLGTLGGTSALISGNISPTYLDSYYKFTLASAQTVKVTGSGLSLTTTAMTLEDGSGNVLASQDSLSAMTITQSMSPGTYFLHVSSFAPATAAFKLTLTLSGPAVPDSAGNSHDTARDLGTLNSTLIIPERVSASDPNDFFSFTVPVAQSVTVTLTGLSADADMQVQTPTGVVGEGLNPGTTAETVTATLQPGLYYVDVISPELATASYTLTIKPSIQGNVPPDNAGNTLALARNIGALSGTQAFNDFVGSVDTNDYYKFTLANKSNVTLNLSGLSGNADLQLLNSTGGSLATSAKTGTTADIITKTLDVGTYYARVYPISGASTNYSLTMTGTLYDGAGGTLATALNTGALIGTKTYKDFVGTVDTDDYYAFTLPASANITAGISGLGDNADIELLDSNGVLISNSINTGITADKISKTLGAGKYYVHVLSASPATNYLLTLTGAIIDGAGNTTTAAKNVGTLGLPLSFNDWVGSADANDYYKFAVSVKSDLTVTLSGLTANADLQLLNSAGTLIVASANTGTTADKIVRTIDVGTYFVRVFPVGSTSAAYSLSITSAKHDIAGNTLATADNIGVLGSSSTFFDEIGPADTADYYRFIAMDDANYSFDLSDMTSSNAGTMSLLNSSGGVISNGSSITKQLTAGSTYYILIGATGTQTSYTLSMTAPSPLNVGTLTGTRSFIGSVSPSSPGDYFKFSLNSAASPNFALSGLSAAMKMQIFNSSGTLVIGQTISPDSGDFSQSLAAGSYYVVLSSTSSTGYTLTLS